MTRYLRLIWEWIQCRLYIHIGFLRPANLVLKGSIKLDWFSIIAFDKGSKVELGANLLMKKSVLRINQSVCTVGEGGNLSGARVIIQDSRFESGKGLIVRNTTIRLNDQSEFFSAEHTLFAKENYFHAGMFGSMATIRLGRNVNLRSHNTCLGSLLEIGDNVFINDGTQIRCTNHISIGSNILVSYECIIFDTNTHSTDAVDRYQELVDGYPNEAIQTEATKKKIKTAPIHIGAGVWIGTRAIILKGTRLGNEVIVGAGCVISGMQVPDKKTAFGNPAQIR